MRNRIIVTGGAGFIGSNLVRYLCSKTEYRVLNIDKLAYSGSLNSLKDIQNCPRYNFINIDICSKELLEKSFRDFMPDAVIHLAAESHVDRSIENPLSFVNTNIIGTFNLLEVSRKYWSSLPKDKKNIFRFHHVSTDEVYGDLNLDSKPFNEETRYEPSSPYSASKASSDHLVRSWFRTYGLPILITNCSNNYGPYQHPEKLIPHMTLCAMTGKNLPIYGDGNQIRDWLFVEDHVRAIYAVLQSGQIGETYNIGGNNEIRNIDIVKNICKILDNQIAIKPNKLKKFEDLIIFVKDRPGHDKRYAVDSNKIYKDLSWKPKENFNSGLKKTISWYLENEEWWQKILNKNYNLERLGNK